MAKRENQRKQGTVETGTKESKGGTRRGARENRDVYAWLANVGGGNVKKEEQE